MKTILLLLVCLTSVVFAEDKKPTLPVKVVLKNGAVLNNVSVTRWEKDRVVLKHSGGIDPVSYDSMSKETREAFEANKESSLASESDRKAERAAAGELEQRVRNAIVKHALVLGMTPQEAVQSWGKPDRINGGSDGHEQWIYNRDSIENTVYVYFRNGKLSSWQDSR